MLVQLMKVALVNYVVVKECVYLVFFWVEVS